MALFGFGKKKKDEPMAKPAKAEAPKKEVAVSASTRTASASVSVRDVILRPRITEKASNMMADNVYTFDVRSEATKGEVLKAVRALYKVQPLKVRIVRLPAKRVRMRRKRGFGTTAATKKAYVSLKDGDTINLSS